MDRLCYSAFVWPKNAYSHGRLKTPSLFLQRLVNSYRFAYTNRRAVVVAIILHERMQLNAVVSQVAESYIGEWPHTTDYFGFLASLVVTNKAFK